MSLNCPRCGDGRYQVFNTHSYCLECNYSRESESNAFGSSVPLWALETLNEAPKATDFALDSITVRPSDDTIDLTFALAGGF